jgi:hypothetical protein
MSKEPGMTQAEAAQSGHAFATKIRDHQPVVGSDGEPVGTVDAVEGERIKLARSDPQAGGEHHYIPLSAIANVDHAVRLAQPAAEAMREWRRGDETGGLR